MQKKVLFLLLAFAAMASAMAGPVTKARARQLAADFLQMRGDKELATKEPAKVGLSGMGNKETPAYYIFNVEEQGGFIVVAGDDRVAPILGYTEEGGYDETNVPDNFRAWMEGYAEQIELLQVRAEAGATPTATEAMPYNPDWSPVSPLLQTQWNQGAPFNDLCPFVDGYRCPTGCVATAMTQIMYYHRWPQGQTTSIPAYTTEVQKINMPELKATVFEWDKMPLFQTEEDIDNAAARLNLYAGQSVKMNYEPYASGAHSGEVLVSLFKHFGYDQNIRYLERVNCTIAEWHNLIYTELKERRPVFYSGFAPDVGHAFVCDGYEDNGYYHINWGWGGHCDGYFLLEVLNPDGTGTGGTSTGQGYTDGQAVILGCQPPTGQPAENLYLAGHNVQLNGLQVSANFRNNNARPGTFNFGWGIENADGSYTPLMQYTSESLDPFWGYDDISHTLSATGSMAQPGTYRVVPISREVGKDALWKSSVPSTNYIEVKVNANKTLTAALHPQALLSATAFNCPGNLCVGMEQNVDVTIKNTGEEFYGPLLLFASRTDEKGEYKFSEIAAVTENGTSVVRFNFTPDEVGEWNIWITTDFEGNNVIGQHKVEIIVAPTEEAQIEIVSAAAEPYPTTMVNLVVRNNGNEPYLRPILMYLWKINGENYDYVGGVAAYNELLPGKTADYSFKFEGLEVGATYLINWLYYPLFASEEAKFLNGAYITIAEAPTGIQEVEAGGQADGDAPYYTIDGLKISKPNKPGVYIRNGRKVLVK